MTFISSLTIPQLGVGAAHALWGFRAAAVGHIECPTLARGYHQACGPHGVEALSAILVFARTIGANGARRIGLATPGCCGVTADEVSVVGALAAAQAGEDDKRDAHLEWLLVRGGCAEAISAADGVARVFSACGVAIDAPSATVWRRDDDTPLTVHYAEGYA